MTKHLLKLTDLTEDNIRQILDVARQVKTDRHLYHDFLHRKSIGLLFQKPSNRTRVSFEVAIHQLGGNCLYLGPDEINLGIRESSADVSQTLSRYLDGIVARVNAHQDIRDLAKYSSVPIINGLSDSYHPCQALTDIFSIKERLNKDSVKVAYIGDGNNVCHSLLLACGMVGFDISVATPEGYEAQDSIIKEAKKKATHANVSFDFSHDPKKAVKNADVIYADVWVSMGQEDESEKRLNDFEGFQINESLCAQANSDFIFMHCLPAHRGEEVTKEVIDGKHSIVFDQAENRLHTQKAILIYLFGEHK